MTDPIVELRNKLIAGGMAYVFGVELPEKHDPDANPAVVMSVTGGDPHPEVDGLVKYRVQLGTWAGVNKHQAARTTEQTAYGLLHGFKSAVILSCLLATAGQDLTDPDSGYARVISFYEVLARG